MGLGLTGSKLPTTTAVCGAGTACPETVWAVASRAHGNLLPCSPAFPSAPLYTESIWDTRFQGASRVRPRGRRTRKAANPRRSQSRTGSL